MKNGFNAKTSGETVGVVTPTSRLSCSKCGKVCNAQYLSAPDFREIMMAYNVGRALEYQIRWVEPKHVLAAARCDTCRVLNGKYWSLVRAYSICAVNNGGRSVQEPEFVDGALRQSAGTRSDPGFAPDLSYRAPMQSSDRVGEYHSLMQERHNHDGMPANGNRQRIDRMAGTTWEDLPKGKKISRRATMRNKGREMLSRSHNRVDEYEAQLEMGRTCLARGDED